MKRRDHSIYVRIDIRGSLDRLWHLTQTPDEHQRWDLRFTEIDYSPWPDRSLPQQFTYATRIGFGMAIRGRGETVGEREAHDGTRASALRFWSDDPKSLIDQGSGFWKYEPRPGGVRFLTRYDYTVRFGTAGRMFDRWIFRPLMGWATAWSFDRLRLWIERSIEPDVALRLAIIYSMSRLGVAFVWAYHGLVPKLLFDDADERTMLADAGVSAAALPSATIAIGVAELSFALAVLIFWRSRWPLWLTAAAMALATIEITLRSPRFLTSAFSAATLNLATALLAAVALLTIGLVPFAARCVRREGKEAR